MLRDKMNFQVPLCIFSPSVKINSDFILTINYILYAEGRALMSPPLSDTKWRPWSSAELNALLSSRCPSLSRWQQTCYQEKSNDSHLQTQSHTWLTHGTTRTENKPWEEVRTVCGSLLELILLRWNLLSKQYQKLTDQQWWQIVTSLKFEFREEAMNRPDLSNLHHVLNSFKWNDSHLYFRAAKAAPQH